MIDIMRNSSSWPLADWIALTVRWAFIAGASLWFAYHNSLDSKALILILGMLIVNLAVSVLTAVNQNTFALRVLYLFGDFAFALLAFFLANNPVNLAWIGLLPVATAALYFQWLGAILAILLSISTQALLVYTRQPSDLLILLAVMVPLYLVVGLPFALISERAIRSAKMGSKSIPRQPGASERKDRESRKLIYDLISALSATLNYQRVLETSLDLSADTLDELDAPEVDRLFSAVLLYSGTDHRSPTLHIATARHILPSDRDLQLPGTSGLLAHAIDEGVPSLSRNLSADVELSHLASLRECRSAFCLPLRAGLDAYGILLFAHPKADFFTPDRREVLEIVGKQSVIAIQNARLYQDLEQEKNRMMEIQEESRKKLARDLHDGPTQSVSAIAMRVNFARRLMERDLKAAAEELYKIEELARRTTKEIRHMLFTLRPLVLESQGLVATLESMAEKMKETFNQNVTIQADPRVVDAIESSKQAVVFYIAEEAVNNARKHAQAGHVWVRLKMLREGLSLLEVEDDGVGFDVNSVGTTYDTRGSLGMINLRERTELVNGVLRIDSAPGRGTRVQVVIPLTEEAADRIRRGV
jgi:signal transduction histidine kinase